ncbi:MAG: diacylglycerol kinase family protein [Actinomycetota bacterium]
MSPTSRPAAVLIVNPNAGRLAHKERADVVAALATRFDLRTLFTTARDTGTELAAAAVEDGVSLIIAFGGDGHVNEVVNGVAGSAATVGIVPGGTMNVFARSLGIPLDPLEATEHLVAALGRPPRWVPLGLMDDRYFTFAAGCGFDAEAAALVDRDIRSKRRFGELFFYWSALRVLATTYRHRSATMTLRGPFGETRVAMAIACNSGPYAYLAGRPVNIAPDVRLDAGLDVFALTTMRVEALPFYFWRVAVSGDLIHHADAFYRTDLTSFEIEGDRPFPRHVDGEPLEPATSARFSMVPAAIRIRA